ncbi:hypothetical protein LB505_012103 [Fusarium chuoi]|nr:hypothetical protein LB505_012103 [Fusarium chuoi]
MPSAAALSKRLSNHARTLAHRVMVNRYRSVEIVLAFMVNIPWMFPGQHSTDDETCTYISIANTVATDLSLHKSLISPEMQGAIVSTQELLSQWMDSLKSIHGQKKEDCFFATANDAGYRCLFLSEECLWLEGVRFQCR